ncbi:hypothetical protein DL96DRAFT_1624302 [Flagelloscypha sp. PMI_526]|nr:hypothetical protein DL96DRAFT_1624302 [Flagelloscypha sp. PMI_526]
MHSLESLPEDVLVAFLSSCSIQTILSLRRCSRTLENISRQRLVWLTVLREQIEEADMTLAQFYPYTLECTTSLDLELYATARYKFFWRLGNQLNCPPCSVGTLHAPNGPWRAAAISFGGQWIAAIHDQRFQIYHLGAPSDYESRRGAIQPSVLAEETLDLLSDTDVSIYWDSSTEFGHVLEIVETGGSSTGTKHWLFKVNVPESFASPLRLELTSTYQLMGGLYTCIHGADHPVLCMSSDQPSPTLWFREGVRVPVLPLKFDDDIMFYTGLDGIIAVCDTDGVQLNVYRVPNIKNPRDGDSLELVLLDTFDWSEETEISGFWHIRRSSAFTGSPPSHDADTGRFVANFVVTIQSDDYELGHQVEFLHKDLVVHYEHDKVVRCELLDGRKYIVPHFHKDYMMASPILHSSKSLNFLWFADSNWHTYTKGNYWQAMVCATLDGDPSKDRTAFLGFGRIYQSELHPDRLDICTLSGRGLNFSGNSLYVFDWALDG